MEQREKNRKILIACSMIEDEIRAVLDLFCTEDIEVRWQEKGHHNDPDRLRDVIQAEINRAEADGADTILLAYGLCGNGAAGWHTKRAVLAMPRFDDCVNMLLCTGKRDRRNYLKAGSMYLTAGWIKDEGALPFMIARAKERYGERRGLHAIRRLYEFYSEITVIDTGCYPLAPVLDCAEHCAGLLSLQVGLTEGGNHILRKLLTCAWDEDIVVKQPGEPVTSDDFSYEDKLSSPACHCISG